MQTQLTAIKPPAMSLLSIAGAAGISVPVLMWTAFFVFGLTRPGYNLLLDAASELGKKGTTNALMFNTVHFYAAGTLMVVFAAGLWAVDKGRVSKVAAVILALVGVTQVLSGYLTLDPGSASASSLHENLGLTPVFGVPVAALLMTRGLNGTSRTASLVLAAIMLLMIVTFIILMVLNVDISIGLFQRFFIGIVSIWIVIVGLWLRTASH